MPKTMVVISFAILIIGFSIGGIVALTVAFSADSYKDFFIFGLQGLAFLGFALLTGSVALWGERR
jgi:predicted esterase